MMEGRKKTKSLVNPPSLLVDELFLYTSLKKISDKPIEPISFQTRIIRREATSTYYFASPSVDVTVSTLKYMLLLG